MENAIASVLDLGNQLCEDTASAVHRFRMDWVHQLVERYRANPGRPVVRLSDLMDSTMILVNNEPCARLSESMDRFHEVSHTPRDRERYRRILDAGKGHPTMFVRLKTWRLFCGLTGLKLDDVEPFVTRILMSGGQYKRMVKEPKLPFNLATSAGAKLLGYRLDSNYRNPAFTNKDPILHEAFRNAVSRTVGKITITETRSSSSGFTSNSYVRTNVGYLVTTLMTVAGLDNSAEQRVTNNPAPLWLFLCPLDVMRAFLAALWDAEGSVNKQDLKLRQTIEMNELSRMTRIPDWPNAIRCTSLDDSSRDMLFSNPPRILTSAALLLRALGIVCHVEPDRISNTKNGVSAYWHLRILRNESVRLFHDQVKLLSAPKSAQLSENAKSMKWSWRNRLASRKA